jgi:hypothetical protein
MADCAFDRMLRAQEADLCAIKPGAQELVDRTLEGFGAFEEADRLTNSAGL